MSGEGKVERPDTMGEPARLFRGRDPESRDGGSVCEHQIVDGPGVERFHALVDPHPVPGRHPAPVIRRGEVSESVLGRVDEVLAPAQDVTVAGDHDGLGRLV